MDLKYIVVQAGGKGTRMKQLTYNKPKALVPIDNLPMLFHLFKKFPNKEYIIIGDYKFDVLTRYLSAFATVKYSVIDARGKKGTCAGLRESLDIIPENEPFMLIWSDLILPADYSFPDEEGNYVGLSTDFSCRWRYENGIFSEIPSEKFGVAGHFIFEDKSVINDVPVEGEFVRWLRDRNITWKTQALHKTKEYGLLSEYNKLEKKKCRPFNKITLCDGKIIKEAIDEQGKQLAKREVAWYERVKDKGFKNIPQIYSTNPLVMEHIDGKNIYEYQPPYEEKKKILNQLITALKQIHSLGCCSVDDDSYYDAYIAKTFKRLEKVYDLVPFAKDSTVKINGIVCPNVFNYRNELEKMVDSYKPDRFEFLHGDNTFSNMMLRRDGTPVMIDPRGYFGNTELYGDPAYDWVKLYYSLASNYDQFNLKRFSLMINDDDVELSIESNHWEDMEDEFFSLLNGEVTRRQMKVLLAITWLSLTTYAWEDYDSICGAYYEGLFILKEALEMEDE